MRAALSVVLGLLAAPAHAGVTVQEGVPFTADQLEAAIAARGVPAGRIDIEVSRSSPERLEVVTPAGRWEIEIGEASGETAARVVALHVVELAAERSPLLVMRVGASSTAEPVAPAGGTVGPARKTIGPATPPPATRRYRLAMFGILSRGLLDDGYITRGGALEVTRQGRWIAGGGVAWQRGLLIDREGATTISADMLRARAVGGVTFGPAELIMGAFAGRVIVDNGNELTDGWALGLQAEARVEALISGRYSIVFAAYTELFRHRIELGFDSARLDASPRVALGGGVALAWTGGPR